MSVGDFSFGSYIYTNDGKADSGGKDNESRTVDRNSPIWGKNRNKGFSTWKNGQVFSAPVWIGYRRGNQNFYLNYENFKTGGYFYSGYYNPLSLWGK